MKASRVRRTVAAGVVTLLLVGVGVDLARSDSPPRPRTDVAGILGSEPSKKNVPTYRDIAGQPVRGPRDAPVTIVEFTDYACEFCARHYTETFEQLLQEYDGKIRYVVRNFPVAEVHPAAPELAEAAECAHAQGEFWAYHDALFLAQSSVGGPNIRGLARSLGLDGRRFDRCLDSGAAEKAVADDLAAAAGSEVTGTPTFFINGRKTLGAKSLDYLKAEVDAALVELETR